jgi:hypothetical protein
MRCRGVLGELVPSKVRAMSGVVVFEFALVRYRKRSRAYQANCIEVKQCKHIAWMRNFDRTYRQQLRSLVNSSLLP